jgi:hypothetical protein
MWSGRADQAAGSHESEPCSFSRQLCVFVVVVEGKPLEGVLAAVPELWCRGAGEAVL